MALIKRMPPASRPGPKPSAPDDTCLASEKSRLRQQYRAVRDSIADDERINAEADMLAALYATPLFRQSDLVCLYAPIGSEPDLFPAWRRAFALGKQVAMPCTGDGPDSPLCFRLLPAYDPRRLVPGPFGTSEPNADCPLLAPAAFQDAMIVLPGLAFDEAGARLGYGRGCYDRFLVSLFRRNVYPQTIGLAFDACVTEALPRGTYDVPARYVLTERRLLVTHADYSRFRL